MRQRFTDKFVRSLPVPDEGHKIHWDENPGFGARITAGGSRSFVLRYRTSGGLDRTLTIGNFPVWGCAAARERAAELRRAIDSGADPLALSAAERQAPTMKDLAERFEAEHVRAKRESTQRDYLAFIKNDILPVLGNMKVADVSFSDVDRLHRHVAKRAPVRANRCVSALSKMFALAIRWQMRPDNPCKGVSRTHEDRRERFLSPAELPALIASINDHADKQAANIFKFLLLTGARRGEVMSARWNQFDREAGVWVKPSAYTKQKKEHRVPLSEAAMELLDEIYCESGGGEYVFPSPRTEGHRIEIKNDWAAVCKAAGISELRMHDLRHSYASMLVNSGLSFPVIGALLGHTQVSTTSRYAHLADDPLRQATERVGKMVTAAKTRGGNVVKFSSERTKQDY
jgi:integrase